ncbi:MAG: hypothetical protein J1E58_07530, partial [Prevotella sp.]|nr:hypothetical protein [Prevotella sp.]
VAESLCSGLYSYNLRHQIADTLSRGLHPDFQGVLQVAVKEVWGMVCLIGTLLLLLMLLYVGARAINRKMQPFARLG